MQSIYQAGIQFLKQPPCSTNLVPSNYILFQKMEEHLLGRKRRDNDVMSAVNLQIQLTDEDPKPLKT